MTLPNVLDQDGFKALVATLAGLNISNVEWDEVDPNNAMVDPESAVRVTLTLFGLSALGVDEHRVAYEPPGYAAQSQVTTEIGNREVTINVKVEAYDRGIQAAEIVDRIRTGIRAAASTTALDAMRLAFEYANKTTIIRTTREQREVSVAVADFVFGGIAQQVSDIKLGYGWVEKIDGMPLATAIIPGTFGQ